MKGFLILLVAGLFSIGAFAQEEGVTNKGNPIVNAEIINRDNRELNIQIH